VKEENKRWMNDEEELMSADEILRRAYKWFGVKAPTKYTFALRDDYYKTMKIYSAWIRKDKGSNEEWWADWKKK
jgi:hypothetical protein